MTSARSARATTSSWLEDAKSHCSPMPPGRFDDDPVDLPPSSDIDALSGFIEQEDSNWMHALEPPAQDDLLLRAARQLASVPMGQDCTECHHLGRLSEHPPFRSPTAEPERGQASKAWQQDIVACIEVGKKALSQAVGGDKCNAACQRRGRHAQIDHTTVDQHAAARRPPRAENCLQDLRATRAKGAEEAYHLARLQPQD